MNPNRFVYMREDEAREIVNRAEQAELRAWKAVHEIEARLAAAERLLKETGEFLSGGTGNDQVVSAQIEAFLGSEKAYSGVTGAAGLSPETVKPQDEKPRSSLRDRQSASPGDSEASNAASRRTADLNSAKQGEESNG